MNDPPLPCAVIVHFIFDFEPVDNQEYLIAAKVEGLCDVTRPEELSVERRLLYAICVEVR